MTEKEYGKLVKDMAPKSPIVKDCVLAFLVGGAICALGQLIQNGYIALGVDREYARKFGTLRYPGCPYLTIGMDGQMTAQQWNAMMRRALEAMDDRGQSLGSEKFLGMIRSLIKG